MYSILLVDDESAVLQGLLQAIPWKEYGFEDIRTAGDGAEALERMDECAADLLVTDIRMPKMDGLELLRTVRSRHPRARFIILTAYDEFEYAREALRLGAENYLLKPINVAELSATVTKALENIENRNKAQSTLMKSDAVFRENVLSRWVSGDLDGAELCDRATVAGCNVFSRSYCVLIAKPLAARELFQRVSAQLESALSSKYDCYGFSDFYGSRVMIIGGADVPPAGVKAMIRPVIAQFGEQPAVFVALGIEAGGYPEVFASYMAASEIVRFCMLFPHNSIVLSEDVKKSTLKKLTINYADFCTLLREASEEQLLKATNAVVEQILDHTSDSVEAAKALVIELLLHIDRETARNMAPGQELPYSMQSLFTTLDSITTRAGLTEWICAVIDDAWKSIRKQNENLSPVINRVLQYIQKNYRQPLSIKSLSGTLGINSSYLGYLFKQETGEYFSNYLNRVRIQASEELILNTDMNVQEIALKAGYSDVSYFNLVFRKVHGMSPNKYRRINKSEDL